MFHPILHGLLAFLLHVSTLSLLALRRRRLPPYNEPPLHPSLATFRVPAWLIRSVAVVAATHTLLIPVLVAGGAGSRLKEPFAQCGLRIVCVFYACKVLDLGLARANGPPTRLRLAATSEKRGEGEGVKCSYIDKQRHGTVRDPVPMHTSVDVAAYVFALCTQMRYNDFNIAVKQPHRPHDTADGFGSSASNAKTWWQIWRPTILPLIIIPSLAVAVPIAETKCLLLLLLIQIGFEGLHALLHPNCPHKLFYRPFEAASMGAFWTTHWHACAAPLLRSLAYVPGRNLFGRGFGVVMAFSLTGAWHAWASAALSETNKLAWMVWSLFVMFGLVCGLEQIAFGQKQGSLVQRAVVWSCALTGAGMCWRELECSSKIAWMRNGDQCIW